MGLRNDSGRQVQFRPLGENFGRKVLHAVVESGNGDPAVVVEDAAEDTGQDPDRILRTAAKNPGMQIPVGGLDLHLVVDQARATPW